MDDTGTSKDIELALRKARNSELKRQQQLLTKSFDLDQDTARHLANLINACVNYAAIVSLAGGSKAEQSIIFDALRAALVNIPQDTQA